MHPFTASSPRVSVLIMLNLFMEKELSFPESIVSIPYGEGDGPVVAIALPEWLLEHDLCLSARSRYDFFHRGVGLAVHGAQGSPQDFTLGR